jgi:hypothetical protein
MMATENLTEIIKQELPALLRGDPALRQWRQIARLSGFLGRKGGDGQPA